MKKRFPKAARHKLIVGAKAIEPILAAAAAMPAVMELPTAFNAQPAEWFGNAIAPMVCRQAQTDLYATIWLKRSYSFSGDSGDPPESYARLGTVKHFAHRGKMVSDFTGCPVTARAVDEPENELPKGFKAALTRLELAQIRMEGIDKLLPEISDFDGLADTLLLLCRDEIMSITQAGLTDAGVYQLTVLRGRFGTPIKNYTARDDVWIIPRARLTVLQHPYFYVGNPPQFKITIGQQPLTEAVQFTKQFAGASWPATK
jgi:hypothetical protein